MHRSRVILFVNPSVGTSRFASEDQLKGYLTLGSLASALRDKTFLKRLAERLGIVDRAPVGQDLPDHAVHVLHLSLKPGDQSLARFLKESIGAFPKAPDLVGMTATSADLEEAREVARVAARSFPEALRAIGGPHASVLPEETLRHSEYQVACFGEGVETLAEFVLRWPMAGDEGLARLEGIAYKDSCGNLHRNPPRRLLLPLDDYPFPSASLDLFWPYSDNPNENCKYPVSVLAGYGCPHDCIFCAQRCIHAGKVRERSAENLFAEVTRLYAQGFRKFAFVQETFLNSRGRVRRFCELVRESGLAIEWTVEARADQVSRGGLAKMRSAGLKFIQLGVESGDEDLLRTLGKAVSHALSAQDLHAERHFKDVAADPEPLFGSFLKFLSVARFENGFECMWQLRLPNRIKWMKLCGIAWLFSGEVFSRFAFTADESAAGENLDLHLGELKMETFDRCLEAADRGEALAAPFLERLRDGGVQVFGIRFGVDVPAGRLTVLPLPS